MENILKIINNNTCSLISTFFDTSNFEQLKTALTSFRLKGEY